MLEFLQFLDQIQQIIDDFQPQDLHENAVFVIGPKGVGKSTIINQLADKKLFVKFHESQVGYEVKDPIVPIGVGDGISTSLFPQVLQFDNVDQFKNMCFIDFPEELDGVVIQMINEKIKQKLARQIKKFKVLVVNTEDSLKEKGSNGLILQQTLQKVSYMLNDDLNKYSESIGLLVTFSDRYYYQLDYIKKNLKTIMNQKNFDYELKEIFNHFINDSAYTCLSKPSEDAQDGDEYSSPKWWIYSQESRIEYLVGKTIKFSDIQKEQQVQKQQQLRLGPELKQQIDIALKIVVERAVQELKQQLQSWKDFRIKIIPKQLFSLKEIISNTITIENSFNLIDFVSVVNSVEFLPQFDPSRLEKLDREIKFLGSFTDQSSSQTWGKLIGLKEHLNMVLKEIQQMLDSSQIVIEDQFEIKEDSVTITRFNLQISDIKEQLESIIQQNQKIKNVYIYVLNELKLEQQLELIGVNLHILATNWQIFYSTLNLTGRKQLKYPKNKQKARNGKLPEERGKDGKPGLPGHNGGNFYGFGLQIEGADQLTLINSGGQGGPGQDGGDGANGVDGTDAIQSSDEKYIIERDQSYFYLHSYLVDKYFPSLRYERHNVSFTLLKYRINSDKPGKKGGDGGDGGVGGKGGLEGQYKLICGDQDISDKIKQQIVRINTGVYGQGGKGGSKPTRGRNFVGAQISGYGGASLVLISAKLWLDDDDWKKWEDIPGGEDGTQGWNYKGLLDPKPTSIQYAKVHTRFLEQTLKLNGRLNFIDLMYSDLIICLRQKFKATQLQSLISQSLVLEQNQSNNNNFSLKKLYQDFQIYCQEFYNEYKQDLSQSDINILNYISSLTSSSLSRLNSQKDTVVVVDILKYLKIVKENVEKVEKLEIDQLKEGYKQNYNDNINNKLEDSQKLLDLLEQDIDDFQNSMQSTILQVIEEIFKEQDKLKENNKKLKEKKEKLKKRLFWQKILDGCKVVTSAMKFLGPIATIIGSVVNTQLDVAEGFLHKDKNKVYEIPAKIKKGLQGIDDVYVYQNKVEQKKIIQNLQDNQILGMDQEIGLKKSEFYVCQRQILEQSGANTKEQAKVALKEFHALTYERQISGEYKKIKKSVNQQKVERQKRSYYKGKVYNGKLAMDTAATGMRLFQNIEENKSKIAIIDQQIKNNGEQITQLTENIDQIQTTFYQAILNTDAQVQDIKKQLENTDKFGTLMQKFKVKNYLSDLNLIMSKISEGFDLDQQMSNIVGKVQNAMETMIDIYDQIDSYKDQVEFSNYMFSLTSTSTNDIPQEYKKDILTLKALIQKNLLIQQYHIAMKAFLQWSFPYSSYYLQEISQLNSDLSPALQYGQQQQNQQNLTQSNIKSIIEQLYEKVQINQATVQPKIDNTIINQAFIDDYPFAPFIEWSQEIYPTEVSNLLEGRQVNLLASPELAKRNLDAVKFSQIKLQMVCDDQEENSRLQELLRLFQVELIHSGESNYKVNGQYYKIQSNGPFEDRIKLVQVYANEEYGNNETSRKLAENTPLLSPYTLWTICLKPLNKEDVSKFSQLSQIASNIKLQLVGQGQYVNLNENINIQQYSSYQAQKTVFFGQLPKLNPDIPSYYTDRFSLDSIDTVEDIYIIQKQLAQLYEGYLKVFYPFQGEEGFKEQAKMLLDEHQKINSSDNKQNNAVSCLIKLDQHQWGQILLVAFNGGNYASLLYTGKEDSSKIEQFKNQVQEYGYGINIQQEKVNCRQSSIHMLALQQIFVDILKNIKDDKTDYSYIRKYLQKYRVQEYCELFVKGSAIQLQEDIQRQENNLILQETQKIQLEELSHTIQQLLDEKNINVIAIHSGKSVNYYSVTNIYLEINTVNVNSEKKECEIVYQLTWSSEFTEKYGDKVIQKLQRLNWYEFKEIFNGGILYPKNGNNIIGNIDTPEIKTVNLYQLMERLNVDYKLSGTAYIEYFLNTNGIKFIK